MKEIYLCDLHADAHGFRVLRLSSGGFRCKECVEEATQVCDANTPPNEVSDD